MPNTILETTPDLDLRLIDMIAGIRNDVLHLLRADQRNPPSAGDVTLCLGILDKAAGAMWKLAETQRVRADTEFVLAEVQKIRGETEKIGAQRSSGGSTA